MRTYKNLEKCGDIHTKRKRTPPPPEKDMKQIKVLLGIHLRLLFPVIFQSKSIKIQQNQRYKKLKIYQNMT